MELLELFLDGSVDLDGGFTATEGLELGHSHADAIVVDEATAAVEDG